MQPPHPRGTSEAPAPRLCCARQDLGGWRELSAASVLTRGESPQERGTVLGGHATEPEPREERRPLFGCCPPLLCGPGERTAGGMGAVPDLVLEGRRRPERPLLAWEEPAAAESGRQRERPEEDASGVPWRRACGWGLQRTCSSEEVAAQQQGASARSTNLLAAAAPPRPNRAPGTEILARLSLPLFLDSSSEALPPA